MNGRKTPNLLSSLEERRTTLMNKVEQMVAERKRRRHQRQTSNASCLSLSDVSFSEEDSYLHASNLLSSFEERLTIRVSKPALLSSLEERRRILMKKVEQMAAERKRRKFWARRHIKSKSSLSESDFSFSISEDGSYLHSLKSSPNGSPSLEEKRTMLMAKVESMVAERKRQRAWQKNLQLSGCMSLSDFSFSEESCSLSVKDEEEEQFQEATTSLLRSAQEVPQSDLSSISISHHQEIQNSEADADEDWYSYDGSDLSCISGNTEHESIDSMLSCPQEILVMPNRAATLWRNN